LAALAALAAIAGTGTEGSVAGDPSRLNDEGRADRSARLTR